LLTGLTPLDLIVCAVTTQETTMATHKAYVVHHVPGRLRLRVPAHRADTDFFEDVSQRLMACKSVREVVVNPLTAGILLHYEADLPTLLLEATEAGLTELAEVEFGLPPLVPVATQLTARMREVDGHIARATHDTVNGTSIVVLGLLLAGGLQVLRGHLFGSAVPLLWYAWQAVSGPPTQRG
jgi:hypothetical protein